MKRSSDVGAEQVEQQSARNREAHPAAQQITSYKIEKVSNGLRRNDANLHPQRRCLNQPTAAAMSVALKRKNRRPTDLPADESCGWAPLFSAQTLSRDVPGQTSVVPARAAMQHPNSKKTPIAS